MIDFCYSEALPPKLELTELAVLLSAASVLSVAHLSQACYVRVLGTLGAGDLAGVMDVYAAAHRCQDDAVTKAVRWFSSRMNTYLL